MAGHFLRGFYRCLWLPGVSQAGAALQPQLNMEESEDVRLWDEKWKENCARNLEATAGGGGGVCADKGRAGAERQEAVPTDDGVR